ncbi:MAG: baseplate J/gp47 family protein [Anaeromicrobium sp.]|jgi:hypothetical protein|uniref:baseplate J/gp47 family protein n=1 Tax=Anaeromicrobium sp. TaxID=1929132 RepID=UPI0025E06A68|nr:baseplate J/gp47 family protein [Anaeromicrobium sp.]MCT4593117.1 baseplate J/gp47 family protein [Anaeromicrobium sp.]
MKAPIIDDRKFKDLIHEMKELVPYFTPEWKFSPEDPDVGTALFMVIALQLQETIDLFNRSLDKNFLSFLNYMNICLKPPKAAKVPLVFNLSEGTKKSIPLKAGTRVFGRDDKVDKLVSFETDTLMEITPAKILRTFYTCGKRDRIVKIDDPLKEDIYFNPSSENLQEHAIYISTEYILTCSKPMEFQLIFDYPLTDIWPKLDLLVHEEYVSWMYYSQDEWIEFHEVKLNNNIISLVKDNDLLISKNSYEDSKWIKCVIKEEKIKYFQQFFIDRIYMRSRLIGNKGEIEPTGLYLNDKAISKEESYAFGEFFNELDTIFINSDDVLSKKGSYITISFDLELIPNKLSNRDKNVDWKLIMKSSEINRLEDPKVSIHTVKWYYYNGVRWEPILVDKKNERLFYYLNHNKCAKIKFKCPKDMEPVEVNGEEGYFIKVVVERVENYVHTDGIYMSPLIRNLKMTYDYKDNLPKIEKFICYNNLEEEDYYNKLNSSGVTFYPFKDLGYEGNALYLLLDKALLNGPINLLFLIDKINNQFIYDKKMNFEYLCKNRHMEEWKKAKVYDETKALTQNGIISISSLNNFVKKKLFNEEGYWIRLLFNEDDELMRYVKGIYLNGVWATQQLSINEEYIDFTESTKDIYLSETPIIDMELWVNEVDSLSQKEISEILERKDISTKITYDYLGTLKELWVKWKPVKHFYHACPDDRVYTIDRLTGNLLFGDGVHGKIPRMDLNKSIYANYKVGGGIIGNMKENTITQLEEPIAFIDRVFNPDKGSLGANTELLEDAIRRGVKSIRHRGQGVTIQDIEDLTKDVSSEIYKVKCIKNIDDNRESKKGDLNLIVLLKDKILDGMSYTLKDKIEEHLAEGLPCNLLSGKKLYIWDPEIAEISLNVSLTVKKNHDKIIVRENLNNLLKKFLDYKAGNYGNRGWDIGEMPRDTAFYSILSEQAGVLNVDNINMSVYIVNKFNKKEISIEEALNKKNIIITSGEHKFNIYSI